MNSKLYMHERARHCKLARCLKPQALKEVMLLNRAMKYHKVVILPACDVAIEVGRSRPAIWTSGVP